MSNTYDGKLFVEQDTSGVGIGTTVSAVNPWTENYGSTGMKHSGNVSVTGVSTFTNALVQWWQPSNNESAVNIQYDGATKGSLLLLVDENKNRFDFLIDHISMNTNRHGSQY